MAGGDDIESQNVLMVSNPDGADNLAIRDNERSLPCYCSQLAMVQFVDSLSMTIRFDPCLSCSLKVRFCEESPARLHLPLCFPPSDSLLIPRHPSYRNPPWIFRSPRIPCRSFSLTSFGLTSCHPLPFVFLDSVFHASPCSPPDQDHGVL